MQADAFWIFLRRLSVAAMTMLCLGGISAIGFIIGATVLGLWYAYAPTS